MTEFRALSGGVTTWSPPVQPRRLQLGWTSMDAGDVAHLDRLARRIDAPGPVALVDPLARNLLSGAQGAGIGASAKWAWTGNDIILYGGDFGPHVPVTVSVENVPASLGPDLYWQHPVWPGYPVTPGMVVTWWTPGLVANGAPVAQHRMQWIDAAGTVTSTATSTGAAPVVRTVPAGAAFVRPAVRFSAVGLWELGASIFATGDVSAELVPGAPVAVGEGCPAFSITRYSHAASPGDGRYRDIGLELVEVTR
ncbi:hypothetical protein ACFRK5_16885 [Streptomyces niveus]|uniref:hypothetical protein n=1 Tax=Streptomyces niveus TaxID=193462 RepID=UPI0036A67FBA